jgi:hypothetical protein
MHENTLEMGLETAVCLAFSQRKTVALFVNLLRIPSVIFIIIENVSNP